MKILGIDPATKSGWAHNAGRTIKSGVWDFKNGHFDGAGMCYLKMRKALYDIIPSVELVAFEGVMGHNANATYSQHKYGGYMATIQSCCEELGVPYCGLGVGQIKKFWTGKGNASKDDMIHEARVKSFNPADDNEADAIAIWHYAYSIYGDLL